MENLTLKELIILIVLVAAAVALIVSIVKKSLSILLSLVLCVFLFSGFTWLPEKIKQWTGSDIEPGNINETVNVVKNEVGEYVDVDKIENSINAAKDKTKEYIDENGESWIDAFKSLLSKIDKVDSDEQKNEVIENSVE